MEIHPICSIIVKDSSIHAYLRHNTEEKICNFCFIMTLREKCWSSWFTLSQIQPDNQMMGFQDIQRLLNWTGTYKPSEIKRKTQSRKKRSLWKRQNAKRGNSRVIQDSVCWISADECDWICSSLEGLYYGRSSSDSPLDAVLPLQTSGVQLDERH